MPKIEVLSDGIQPWPVEWWYWSGHTAEKNGRNYSFMLALFKMKPFGIGPVWFTHSLISCIETGEFEPSIDFFLSGLDKGSFQGDEFRAKAGKKLDLKKIGEREYSLKTPRFNLKLRALKPAMPVDGKGLVDLKSAKTWYYSYPRLEASGSLRLKAKDDWVKVTGQAWMDHQCSELTFNHEHVWKWFSFQFADGTDFRCFSYGLKKETVLATISFPDGTVRTTSDCRIVPGRDVWTSPVTGAVYPVAWGMEIPEWKLKLKAQAKIAGQEMLFGLMNYWEGPLKAEGSIGATRVKGDGFMELVGYPKKRLTKMLRVQLERALGRGID
ncbi:MAG: lipocalin family protein [Patescibacteria group bacterium]